MQLMLDKPRINFSITFLLLKTPCSWYIMCWVPSRSAPHAKGAFFFHAHESVVLKVTSGYSTWVLWTVAECPIAMHLSYTSSPGNVSPFRKRTVPVPWVLGLRDLWNKSLSAQRTHRVGNKETLRPRDVSETGNKVCTFYAWTFVFGLTSF
jgi:hypothetical protein